MERKLASIQTISKLSPIEGADRIELATVLGWNLIVKKGEYQEGEKCVYFEVDSFLPIRPEFEFLRDSSYKNSDILGEGFRIRTQKFRGQISQGLLMPLSILPYGVNQEIGTDVTEILGVKKWMVPEMDSGIGTIIGGFCPYCSPTDETRIQTIPEIIDEIYGKPYYITTKMDGTSITVWVVHGEMHVATRTSEIKEDDTSAIWKTMHKLQIREKLMKYGKNLIMQGELCGPKIQNNRLKLTELKWYVFNIIDLDTGRWFTLDEMVQFCRAYGIEMVPVEEVGDSFGYTFEELLDRAMGLYPAGTQKEGIVIRLKDMTYSQTVRKPLSFKVLNNKFLLKEK